MRIAHGLLATAVGGLFSLAPAPAMAQATAEADGGLGKINNQYICRFDASVSQANVHSEAARAAGAMGQVLHLYRNTIRGFAVRLPAQATGRSPIAELRANNPKVANCEQDQYVKAYGKPGSGGGGPTPAQKIDWGVQRVGGPSTAPTGRKAWIIDTGIEYSHPDLNVDQADSRSFIRDPSPIDQNGHGTHVSGTIAACGNTIGVVGIANCAPVVAVRVLDRNGRGSNSDVIAGVDYVGANGSAGDVANMSLGGGVSDALDSAVINAAALHRVRFTLAAGNESDDANNHSPARAGGQSATDGVYTVSAFSQTGDTFASFSNHGNPPIEWAEPGVSILSTYKGGTYATLSGTSMAAPHLAGILMVGAVKADGTVNGDADTNPDSIGHR
jgi:subtilisin family serine protease